MANFPRDQFDSLPDDLHRVGAHRGPRVKGYRFVAFAWSFLACGILVVAGLFVLSLHDPNFSLVPAGTANTSTSTPVGTPTPTITPITDPTSIASRNITITVLNGTANSNADEEASKKLTDAKWTVGSSGPSSETTIKQTVVYYADKANEDVALGVAKTLGTDTVVLSDNFPGAPITVVVGSDFKG
jgi:hypothetical protein